MVNTKKVLEILIAVFTAIVSIIKIFEKSKKHERAKARYALF